MRIKNKLKSQRGFSLAETLLAVLILLLVSAIVANGIPVARNVYNNVIIGSNAQMLLSTAVTQLRNELGTAQDVQCGVNTITYYNTSIQAYSVITLGGGTAAISVQPYVSPADKSTPLEGATPHDLVSNAASNKNLYITCSGAPGFDPNNPDTLVLRNLEVRRTDDTDVVVASLDALKIRPFSVSSTDS